jgi:hypothetical protein
MRRRIRFTLLALIGLLYAISIPWYRADDAPLELIFGLPDWVAVAVGCYVAVAILNAFAWLLTDIPEGEGELHESSYESSGESSGDHEGTSP